MAIGGKLNGSFALILKITITLYLKIGPTIPLIQEINKEINIDCHGITFSCSCLMPKQFPWVISTMLFYPEITDVYSRVLLFHKEFMKQQSITGFALQTRKTETHRTSLFTEISLKVFKSFYRYSLKITKYLMMSARTSFKIKLKEKSTTFSCIYNTCAYLTIN